MPGVEQKKDVEIEEKQYVTFSIGKETFGIDVVRAQEVMSFIDVTHVPNTLPFMKGVIDLRGTIIPLIDLRIKFNLEEREYDQNTVIIIIEVRDLLIGMIVDSVSDVISMAVKEIQETPHFAMEIDKDSVIGFGRVNEQLVIVLDVDRILTADEIEMIGEKEN